jgi:hypothetical protein
MGSMTLSKLQKEQYEEIVDRFEEEEPLVLDNAEVVRLGEVLTILKMTGYIREFDMDNANVFERIGNFQDFDAWQKDKRREERKITRREWCIGVVGAVIGLIPYIVADVIPWILSVITNN